MPTSESQLTKIWRQDPAAAQARSGKESQVTAAGFEAKAPQNKWATGAAGRMGPTCIRLSRTRRVGDPAVFASGSGQGSTQRAPGPDTESSGARHRLPGPANKIWKNMARRNPKIHSLSSIPAALQTL